MNKTFEKIYSENNVILNKDMVLKENTALFEKVYTEAEMLNEMNPKLRALLAAGLIGTAGLGATSCSTPNDDPYDAQYTIEQPTPENPKDSEYTVTFETLGVEEYAESLARAERKGSFGVLNTPFIDLVYDVNEHGFVPAKFDKDNEYIGDGTDYILYVSPSDKISYYIPKSMEKAFDDARKAYKPVYTE